MVYAKFVPTCVLPKNRKRIEDNLEAKTDPIIFLRISLSK